MKVKIEIPFKDDCITVYFDGEPRKDNDSYDDEFGTVVCPDHFTMEGCDLEWDREGLSRKEINLVIKWLENDENLASVYKAIIEAELEYYKNYKY